MMAVAGDATGRIGVGGAGGWADLLARKDDKRGTNGDSFHSLWLRLGLSKKNELVFGYDSIQVKIKDDSSANSIRLRPVTVGLWHSFRPDSRLVPVALLSVGAADVRGLDPTGEEKSQTAFATQGGLGGEYFIADWVSVGALARVHYVLNESHNDRTEATAYTLGVMANLFWGGSPAPEKRVVQEPVPVVVIPVDSDGDGVADDVDACPQTPAGTAVDVTGCPRDSDRDGVIDGADQCPNTPAGSLVNAEGCSTEKVSVTLDVKFASGKSDLSSASDPQLGKAADFMKRFPETSVEIAGYTDNVGSPAKNKALSLQRAQAVRKALVERFGIAAERVTAKGYGIASPVASNATAEGRAANRRVVATVSATKKQ